MKRKKTKLKVVTKKDKMKDYEKHIYTVIKDIQDKKKGVNKCKA
jgi:hypothetical protein